MRLMNLTERQVKVLAEEHIRTYWLRRDSRIFFMSAEECEMYLRVWRGVRNKAAANRLLYELTSEENKAIEEALLSGEFDDVLEKVKR